MRIVVAGAGIFGVTAALSLRKRGHEVVLVDPGPLPHPDAASTDISKLVRMDYGTDSFYTDLLIEAARGWAEWNARWPRPLYHRDGILVICREAMTPGGFEGDSFATLSALGYPLERLDADRLRARFPAWRGHRDGYFNPEGGWGESGEVVAALAAEAMDRGVRHVPARVERLLGEEVITGVVAGESIPADSVVLACGVWTPRLLPELADRLVAVGQPVLHFGVDAASWRAPRFPPWAADIANTGWYGFPARSDGVLKVANHGRGRRLDADEERVVAPEWEAKFRAFFREHLPALADAPLVGTRLCLYCDSFDGDFFVAPHPDRSGLVVATGGSGHAFKFAPVLGEITADVLEGRDNPWAHRFAWRERGPRKTEDARNG